MRVEALGPFSPSRGLHSYTILNYNGLQPSSRPVTKIYQDIIHGVRALACLGWRSWRLGGSSSPAPGSELRRPATPIANSLSSKTLVPKVGFGTQKSTGLNNAPLTKLHALALAFALASPFRPIYSPGW